MLSRLTRPLLAATAAAAVLLVLPAGASAQASCPNANLIVQENYCASGATSNYRLSNESANIGGFATKTSFDRGENIPLKIARNQPTFPANRVDITVYRTGSYGGAGSRLISAAGATGVVVNNNFTCNAMNATTGELDCANWNVTYTIPGSSLPGTGAYVAKIRTTDTGQDNWIFFVVRDDDRSPEAQALVVIPTATYQAYNTWGGKSLYFDKNGGADTVAGTKRAVKVSFNRPQDDPTRQRDGYFGPDFDMVQWLEEQGYDVTYTDDVAVHQDPTELRQHEVVLITGHSEYWSSEEFNGVKAARDAGVSIASFSANTAYWKVRYENGNRRLVCYKTVQGDGSGSSGRVSANDWGPDGLENTADDALGLDRLAGTADDHPENSTTTFRDNGAPPGDPNAPVPGRVGPDMPENQLFGVMYFGDNDSHNYALRVPAANTDGEYSADRIWRRAGLPLNGATSIGTDIVGWEWDSVPVQAQYLSRQPAGVKRLSSTLTTSDDPSWLQDEGRQRANVPPAGMDGTVQAVKYTAPSGALVFASGTMQWSWGLSNEPDARIQQATYNILSDMGIQPLVPTGVTVDPAGSNRPPTAAFTATPANPGLNVTVQFAAGASTDTDGSITKYEWDLDGNGTYETDTGVNPNTSRAYSTEGARDIRLRVTDNGGATDFTVRTVNVIGNLAPTASFTASPNPAVVSQPVALNGSASSDSDGTIVKYEWDLDGNGSFEVDGGATPTRSQTYATTGTRQVQLRVTDNGGKTATATVPVTVNNGGVSSYGDTVLDTPGLIHYWRMNEPSGPTLADTKGTSHATATGNVAYGVPGGPAFDPDRAAHFDGVTGSAGAPVNLSSSRAITIEFWLKWDRSGGDDSLAMEFTPNFNGTDGGFLVDPNSPQYGGTFGVGLGRGTARNNVFFAQPTTGVYHHYAFVMDTNAPAASQVTPYVDGAPVSYQKLDSGTGAGPFASAQLYFMSRAGQSLFGSGDLDEVAIYDRALGAQTIADHFGSFGSNRRPVARFTATPNPAATGQTVTFNGSTSSDPDGSITKYEWDLDGNGSYETNTGSTPTATRAYATEGQVQVGLRVTDNLFGTDTETKTLDVGNKAPVASYTITPNPAITGRSVAFNAGGSSDVDGTITKYEWDLDGNGTYEVDGGTSPTTSHTYAASGTVDTRLRLTDNQGATGTATLPVTITSGGVSSYGDAVLDTPGLVNYWRMGEASGPTFADSKGTSHATATGAAFGVPGAIAQDPNLAGRFDGVNDFAKANVNLSATSQLTVEFWLKWDAYGDDDHLAMELTPNFNSTDGGFIVDPDAPQFGNTFGVGLGRGDSRNNVFFARPSAGAWHHYALVMDTGASAATQITPYVDGRAVSFQKLDSGTGAGRFANSVLSMMSRNGTALFGKGDLDELAIYNRALSAGAIADHYGSFGTNRRPVAAFTATPNPAASGQTVTLNASASSDPDGSVQAYEWDLDGNGSFERDGGSNPVTTTTFPQQGDVQVSLRVIDDRQGTDTETKTVTVTGRGPTAAFTASPNPVTVGQSVAFDGAGSSDPDGTIVKYEWDLDGNGSFETDTGAIKTASRSYTATGDVSVKLRATDDEGNTGETTRTVTVVAANQAPLASFTVSPAPAAVGQTVTFDGTASSDPGGTIVKYEWDLDGNGSFETDTGTTKTASRSYAAAGSVSVKLRVTDNDGLTAQATKTAFINATPAGSGYAAAVQATSGLSHYWRMGELTGGTLADSAGASPATIAGGVSLGAPGGVAGDTNTAASFDGADDSAVAGLDLSGTDTVTLEFWLKWDGYAEDDDLAFEFTPNFNGEAGGFLVDPNSPQDGGRFGVAIGSGLSRNNAFFTRPSAGAWHHYALVLDAGAPGASQITPYVDGQAVSYFKGASGTGGGNFSNSQLFFMSRNASGLFGAGDLDEVALYSRALTPAEITAHLAAGANAPPTASFTASPNPVNTGQTVSFDGTASSDPDGTVAKYEWDLDGNGSYETDTGTTRTASRAYTQTGAVTVGLRVTDNAGDYRVHDAFADGAPGAGGVLHRNARHRADRPGCRVRRGRLHRRRRDDRQVRVGPRRQRQLRDRHRNDQDDQPHLRGRRDPERRAAGDRQRRQHRRGDPRCDYHQPPAQRFVHGHAYRGSDPPDRELQRRRLERSGRHAGSIRVGSRRQRQLRDGHRYHRDHDAGLHHARHRHRRAAGDRQQRRHRDHHAGRDRAERLCAAGPRHHRAARLLAACGHRHDRR